MYTEKYISLERSSWAQLYPLGLSDPRTTEGAKERQSRNFFVVNFFILSAIIVSRPLEIGWSRSWIDRINSFWDINRNMSFTILFFKHLYIYLYIFKPVSVTQGPPREGMPLVLKIDNWLELNYIKKSK